MVRRGSPRLYYWAYFLDGCVCIINAFREIALSQLARKGLGFAPRNDVNLGMKHFFEHGV